jgi:hypothetical protein
LLLTSLSKPAGNKSRQSQLDRNHIRDKPQDIDDSIGTQLIDQYVPRFPDPLLPWQARAAVPQMIKQGRFIDGCDRHRARPARLFRDILHRPNDQPGVPVSYRRTEGRLAFVQGGQYPILDMRRKPVASQPPSSLFCVPPPGKPSQQRRGFHFPGYKAKIPVRDRPSSVLYVVPYRPNLRRLGCDIVRIAPQRLLDNLARILMPPGLDLQIHELHQVIRQTHIPRRHRALAFNANKCSHED